MTIAFRLTDKRGRIIDCPLEPGEAWPTVTGLVLDPSGEFFTNEHEILLPKIKRTEPSRDGGFWRSVFYGLFGGHGIVAYGYRLVDDDGNGLWQGDLSISRCVWEGDTASIPPAGVRTK